jgi:acyl-homoserine lactone acylase PvdQ
MWKKVIFVLLLLLGIAYYLLNPPNANTLTYQGQEIRIERGPEGIPHIYA